MLIQTDSNILQNIRLLSILAVKCLLIQKLTGCLKNRHMRYLEAHILRYIIANMPAALYRYALALVSTGQCAAAMVQLGRSIKNGYLPSRALKAWLFIDGREGVAQDENGAFELVEEGTRLGCQGVLAFCYFRSCGCKFNVSNWEQSLSLARKSSGLGSRYGQVTLGWLHFIGWLLHRALIWRRTNWASCTARALALLETTLKRCGGASLLPPKDIPQHCTMLLSVMRKVTEFVGTRLKPFAGTGSPKPLVTLTQQLICRGCVCE